jgi:hypothetical protein
MDPDGRSISNFESQGPAVVPIVVRNDGYHWGNAGVVRTTVLAKLLVESVCDAERPPRNEKVAGSMPTSEPLWDLSVADPVGTAAGLSLGA